MRKSKRTVGSRSCNEYRRHGVHGRRFPLPPNYHHCGRGRDEDDGLTSSQMRRRNSENHSGRAAATTYRIRVAGVLGEEWSGRTQGMAVSVHRPESGASFTELTGELPDESALMGVLETLYSHGARLLSVERTDEDGSTVVKPPNSIENERENER